MPGAPNFSSLPLDEPASVSCPNRVPHWGYPRADLLGLH
jgi:inner membrane protein